MRKAVEIHGRDHRPGGADPIPGLVGVGNARQAFYTMEPDGGNPAAGAASPGGNFITMRPTYDDGDTGIFLDDDPFTGLVLESAYYWAQAELQINPASGTFSGTEIIAAQIYVNKIPRVPTWGYQNTRDLIPQGTPLSPPYGTQAQNVVSVQVFGPMFKYDPFGNTSTITTQVIRDDESLALNITGFLQILRMG